MKNLLVSGYVLVKNPDTWEYKRSGKLVELPIETTNFNDPEMIGDEIACKYKYDSFEPLTIKLV